MSERQLRRYAVGPTFGRRTNYLHGKELPRLLFGDRACRYIGWRFDLVPLLESPVSTISAAGRWIGSFPGNARVSFLLALGDRVHDKRAVQLIGRRWRVKSVPALLSRLRSSSNQQTIHTHAVAARLSSDRSRNVRRIARDMVLQLPANDAPSREYIERPLLRVA
jgi:hypothetical protein